MEKSVEDVATYTILVRKHGKNSKEVRDFLDQHNTPEFRSKLVNTHIEQSKKILDLLKFALDQAREDEEWAIYIITELEEVLEKLGKVPKEGA